MATAYHKSSVVVAAVRSARLAPCPPAVVLAAPRLGGAQAEPEHVLGAERLSAPQAPLPANRLTRRVAVVGRAIFFALSRMVPTPRDCRRCVPFCSHRCS